MIRVKFIDGDAMTVDADDWSIEKDELRLTKKFDIVVSINFRAVLYVEYVEEVEE